MRVARVEPDGPAHGAGVRAGDDLRTIDGAKVEDAVDVAYTLGWCDGEEADFEFVRDGRELVVRLPAESPWALGIEFEPDRVRTCGNRCVFCFVDQLPPGLRPSLYVKDEDYRLSFLFGNYVTLTNLSAADRERIVRQRLSPLYVSVHSTNDALRRRMLDNPNAPSILEQLRELGESGIRFHAQIVVVPGMNDGRELDRTIDELAALGDTMESVAVVPVGITKHRDGLPKIEGVGVADAAAIVDAVESRQECFRRERGTAFVYAADELYLKAGRRLPPLEAYDDLPQTENGVGLLRSFEAGLGERVHELAGRLRTGLRVVVVTSPLAVDFLRDVAGPLLASVAPIEARFVSVENSLLGEGVTVAGLLTGRDMAAAASEAENDELVLLPGEAFNADGLTIDGMTLGEIAAESEALGVTAARDIVDAILAFVSGSGDAEGGVRD